MAPKQNSLKRNSPLILPSPELSPKKTRSSKPGNTNRPSPSEPKTKSRRISETETTEEHAHTQAEIHSASDISNHDVEGHNIELDAVSGQMLSGGLGRSPITSLGENCFKQNMPPVAESRLKYTNSFAADMRELTNMLHSSVMERGEKLVMECEEKLAQSKKALDAKTKECQAWEEKFNVSQKDHEQNLKEQAQDFEKKLNECLNEHKEKLLNQEEEFNQKLKTCEDDYALASSKQNEHEKFLQKTLLKQEEEFNEKLKTCEDENALASSKQKKEYEKLLENQASEFMILKENLAKLQQALDSRTAECESWGKDAKLWKKVHEEKLAKQRKEYEENLKQCRNDRELALFKEQEYAKLLGEQTADLQILKEQNEEVKASYDYFFARYAEKSRSLQKKITTVGGEAEGKPSRILVKEVAKQVFFGPHEADVTERGNFSLLGF